MRLYDRVDWNGSIFIWPELKEYFFVSEGSFNLLIIINHVPTCTCTCQQILKKKNFKGSEGERVEAKTSTKIYPGISVCYFFFNYSTALNNACQFFDWLIGLIDSIDWFDWLIGWLKGINIQFTLTTIVITVFKFSHPYSLIIHSKWLVVK